MKILVNNKLVDFVPSVQYKIKGKTVTHIVLQSDVVNLEFTLEQLEQIGTLWIEKIVAGADLFSENHN